MDGHWVECPCVCVCTKEYDSAFSAYMHPFSRHETVYMYLQSEYNCMISHIVGTWWSEMYLCLHSSVGVYILLVFVHTILESLPVSWRQSMTLKSRVQCPVSHFLSLCISSTVTMLSTTTCSSVSVKAWQAAVTVVARRQEHERQTWSSCYYTQ